MEFISSVFIAHTHKHRQFMSKYIMLKYVDENVLSLHHFAMLHDCAQLAAEPVMLPPQKRPTVFIILLLTLMELLTVFHYSPKVMCPTGLYNFYSHFLSCCCYSYTTCF